MAKPTQARVRSVFKYDPSTGELIWRDDRPESDFVNRSVHGQYVAKFAGKTAGTISSEGYRCVSLDGQRYLAHKLIWLFVFGEWAKYPDFEIDHVNGIRSDNRIQNLRKVTKSLNQRNASLRSNNTSGVNGVNWVASKKRWVARIWDGPKHVYLGQFKNIEEAAAARAKAERELGYHPGHGKVVEQAA